MFEPATCKACRNIGIGRLSYNTTNTNLAPSSNRISITTTLKDKTDGHDSP